MCKEKKPHVHAELIKAWADGAEIQVYSFSTWEDVPNNKPNWSTDLHYRIKPGPSDLEKYGVESGDIWVTKKRIQYVVLDSRTLRTRGLNSTTMDYESLPPVAFEGDTLLFRRNVVDKL